MVKLNAILAVLAIAVIGALAQDQGNNSSSSSQPAQSSSQGQQSQSSSKSSATSTAGGGGSGSSSSSSSKPSGAGGGSGSGSKSSDSQSSGVCSYFVGDPNVHAASCTYSSTSVPPYNFESVAKYLVNGIHTTTIKEGKPIEDVASDFAKTVLTYYPTLTVSQSELQHKLAKYMAHQPNMPDSIRQQYTDGAEINKIAMISSAAVAIIVGGALFL
jgi:cobalamin biosynthesis Mg chelatase CobN